MFDFPLDVWLFGVSGGLLMLLPIAVAITMCRQPLDYQARATPAKQQIAQRILITLVVALVGFPFGASFVRESQYAAQHHAQDRAWKDGKRHHSRE